MLTTEESSRPESSSSSDGSSGSLGVTARDHLRLLYRLLIVFPFYLFEVKLLVLRVLQVLEIRSADDFAKQVLNRVVLAQQALEWMEQERRSLKQFIVNFLVLLLNIYLMSHTLACLYIATEELNEGVFFKSVYIKAIYFVYQTATVVGYGDATVDLIDPDGVVRSMLVTMIIHTARSSSPLTPSAASAKASRP